MVKRKDFLVVLIVLVFAIFLLAYVYWGQSAQKPSGIINIYVDGTLYASPSLSRDERIEIIQANGSVNIVEIRGERVHMGASSCENQLCVRQGEVTAENWTRRAMGRAIVCLPNRIYIELVLENQNELIEALDLPDV